MVRVVCSVYGTLSSSISILVHKEGTHVYAEQSDESVMTKDNALFFLLEIKTLK